MIDINRLMMCFICNHLVQHNAGKLTNQSCKFYRINNCYKFFAFTINQVFASGKFCVINTCNAVLILSVPFEAQFQAHLWYISFVVRENIFWFCINKMYLIPIWTFIWTGVNKEVFVKKNEQAEMPKLKYLCADITIIIVHTSI